MSEPLSDLELPVSIDWRSKKAVNPVKNQGHCGSCWAFSAVAPIEGRNAVKTGKLHSLSEQQLVDCSKAEGNNGCNGGGMDNAFKYAEKHAMNLESEYPYKAHEEKCKAKGGHVRVASFKNVARNNPGQLKAAVANGPVSVGIQAN